MTFHKTPIALAVLAACGAMPPPPTVPPTPAVPQTVSITPTPTPTTAASTIAAADILGKASGNVPFAQQSGWGAQVLGQYPSAQQIPETGINGTTLPSGET